MPSGVHPKCGKAWNGKRSEHCPVCCETFSGAATGDAHRVGSWAEGTRRCLTPDEMLTKGLVPDAKGTWWGAERVAPTNNLPPRKGRS